MARLNRPKPPIHTHEGATAYQLTAEAELRRTVMACLLWERTFYESGQDVADRITALVPRVPAETVAELAIDARERMKLRHVPLLLAVEMARHPSHRHVVGDTLARVIQRPDELTEVLAIYSRGRTGPKKLGRLSKQVQKGIARAFPKFSPYQLAKYDRKGEVRLRDALFLSHAKPESKEQAEAWRKLIDGILEAPDTWEVALSSGADKRATWERLIVEGKLGALALLRNLRNMKEAGVPDALVSEALGKMRVERVLPFRFIAAAKYAPTLEPALEAAMYRATAGLEPLRGRTALVVDHSASMQVPVSSKSELDRFEAAAALAILAREVCEDCVVVAFSMFGRINWLDRHYERDPNQSNAAIVPPRRGFALRDALYNVMPFNGTDLGAGVALANEQGYDRIVVITDEQSHTPIGDPLPGTHAYVVNVAIYKNGVGYGRWTHIDGWSESILSYIAEYERLDT